MSKIFSASVEDVRRLCEANYYDYIVVGSGIGGGALARQLLEANQAEEDGSQRPRVLLIERGDFLFSTHCLNTARPHWNPNAREGPSQDNDVVYQAVKEKVQTVTGKSYEYVGGPVHCLGGRSSVWGLYSPGNDDGQIKKYFPEKVAQDLNEKAYDEAYKWLVNDGRAVHKDPYPNAYSVSTTTNDMIHDLIQDLGKSPLFKNEFTRAPVAAQFTPRDPSTSLYQLTMGAYSTINWILNRVYNKDERLTVLINTQVLTVNQGNYIVCSDEHKEMEKAANCRDCLTSVASLSLRDRTDKEISIPTKDARIILCAGTIDTAAIALRSGIDRRQKDSKVGKGLMDHDIWGTRVEIELDKNEENKALKYLSGQAIKLQNWVSLKDHEDMVLLNIAINAPSFLGRINESVFPSLRMSKGGELLKRRPGLSYKCPPPKEKNEGGKDTIIIQITFEFCAPLCDKNRVLNLPEPIPTIQITTLQDNSDHVPKMQKIVTAIEQALLAHPKVKDKNNVSTVKFPTSKFAKAGFGVVAHEVGTMRMSKRTDDRVVDDNLKVVGWKNVYVCDLSVFPVSPSANPTLTLVALAQRLGKHLLSLKRGV